LIRSKNSLAESIAASNVSNDHHEEDKTLENFEKQLQEAKKHQDEHNEFQLLKQKNDNLSY